MTAMKLKSASVFYFRQGEGGMPLCQTDLSTWPGALLNGIVEEGYPPSIKGKSNPRRRRFVSLMKVLVCEFQEYGGKCRGSGSSLLIFIELAPSKNDNCEKVKGLLSAFQKHGAECTGLLLIFMLLKYVLSKQISCCV